jgi:hypothetical protein
VRRIRAFLAVSMLIFVGLSLAAGSSGSALAVSSANHVASSSHRNAPPGVDYQMYGNDCANSPCGEHVWITSNPNNVSVRAFVQCGNGTNLYGGWHTSVGQESSTAECGSGTQAQAGYFQWTMQLNDVACWIRPFSWGRAVCT